VLPLLLVVAACGDDDPAGPEDITGTYALTTVGGDPLPVTIDESEGYLLELLGSELVIEAAGTYTETSSYRETVGTDVSVYDESSAGTWDQDGTSLELTDSDQDVISGTVSTTRIVLGGGGFSIVYQKQ
jgi:hypothetical protein